MRKRRSYILITTHAYDRWLEYDGKPRGINKLKSLVHKNLAGHLKVGLAIDHTGAAHLPVNGLYAAVVPGQAGWIVVTVHRGEKIERGDVIAGGKVVTVRLPLGRKAIIFAKDSQGITGRT